MQDTNIANLQSANLAQPRHNGPDDNPGDGTVPGTISEGDLLKRLDSQRITDAYVVVVETPRTGTVSFIPYVQLGPPAAQRSDSSAPYLGIAKWRGTGLRDFKDARRLLRFLRQDLRYLGRLVMVEERDADVQRLGLAVRA
jgi:hypothetical protein